VPAAIDLAVRKVRSYLKNGFWFKVKAGVTFKPEVPAKPMPIVVNTVKYFEDLDLTPNTEIGPKDFFEIASSF